MRDLRAQNVAGRAADIPGTHQQREAHGGGAGRRCPDGELHGGEERDVEQYAAHEMDDERRAVRVVEQADRGADRAGRDRDREQAARREAPAEQQIERRRQQVADAARGVQVADVADGKFQRRGLVEIERGRERLRQADAEQEQSGEPDGTRARNRLELIQPVRKNGVPHTRDARLDQPEISHRDDAERDRGADERRGFERHTGKPGGQRSGEQHARALDEPAGRHQPLGGAERARLFGDQSPDHGARDHQRGIHRHQRDEQQSIAVRKRAERNPEHRRQRGAQHQVVASVRAEQRHAVGQQSRDRLEKPWRPRGCEEQRGLLRRSLEPNLQQLAERKVEDVELRQRGGEDPGADDDRGAVFVRAR